MSSFNAYIVETFINYEIMKIACEAVCEIEIWLSSAELKLGMMESKLIHFFVRAFFKNDINALIRFRFCRDQLFTYLGITVYYIT